jgi:hypothetical protein
MDKGLGDIIYEILTYASDAGTGRREDEGV